MAIKESKVKTIHIVDDFFNKLVTDLDKNYNTRDNMKVGYACECFNNGVLTYSKLIDKLTIECKDTHENIHTLVSKYIIDFGSYEYNPK